MSDNHQQSHVVEESLQENKETKNEAMSMEEKPEEEHDLTQRHSFENEGVEEVEEKEVDDEEAEEQEEEDEEGENEEDDDEDENDEEEDENDEDEDEDEEEDNRRHLRLELSFFRKDVECPICLGIIQNTVTVMKCLHRFCRECIHKSIRLGKKECPTCRVHCPSKRSLRDDPSFDAIIQVLYPNIDKSEKEELASIEKEFDLPNKKNKKAP